MLHIFVYPFAAIFLMLAIALVTSVLVYRYASALRQSGRIISRASYYAIWAFLGVITPTFIIYLFLNIMSSLYCTKCINNASHDWAQKSNIAVNLSAVKEITGHITLLQRFYRLNAVDKSYNAISSFYLDNNINLPLDGNDGAVSVAFLWLKLKIRWNIFIIFVSTVASLLSAFYVRKSITPQLKVKTKLDNFVKHILQIAAAAAILVTCAIIVVLMLQTIRFFKVVSLDNFFLSTVWDPRFSSTDTHSQAGQFGLLPLLLGTIYIAFVAMLVAVPIGLLSAIYMSEYASATKRAIIKPLLEVLAGIPTIVYGFFALFVVGPFLRDFSAFIAGSSFILSQSVLTAGIVIGIMLIPFVSSLSDDALTAVPVALRDSSYGLGATKSETIKKVIFPAALPGIVGALLLSASRAIGETMIVVLAAGVSPNLTLNPFQAMTTITVKIVNQLTGDMEFDSPQTLVAFALGMALFVFTLSLNIIALHIVRKYREQYE